MLLAAVASSVRAFRMACAVILLCAAAGPALRAQTSSAQTTDPCPGEHLKPTLDCSKRNPPDNNEDGTKAALACEWVNTDEHGVRHAFDSLILLTCSTKDVDRKSDPCRRFTPADLEDNKVRLTVSKELKDGTASTTDRDLYQWALGDPDSDGKPKGTAMANFPDALAKVNTLNTLPAGAKKRSKDEEDLFEGELFECTKNLIEKIYQDRSGKTPGLIVAARIHDTFASNKLNLALIQLLDAQIQLLDAERKRGDNVPPTVYSQDIEKFRAASEVDNKRLAKQVADKINSTQQ
jgi:hypothetical protein